MCSFRIMVVVACLGVSGSAIAQDSSPSESVYLERMVYTAPGSLLDDVNLISRLLQQSRMTEAAKQAEMLIPRIYEDMVLAERLALELSQAGLFKPAISTYSGMIERKHDNPEVIYNLALAYYFDRQFSQSLTLLAEHAADSADYYALIGSNQRELGNLSDAVNNLKKAVAKAPGNEDYVYDLAVTLLRANAVSEGLQELQAGIHRFPNSANIHAALGMASYLNGKNAEAIHYYARAIELNSHVADFHESLADVYSATGDFSKAQVEYAAAIRLNTTNPLYYTKEGKNYLKLQRETEAVNAFRKALSCDPEFAEAHLNLGKIAIAHGEFSSAVKHLEKAVLQNDAPAEAYYQLSVAYRRTGQSEPAAAALKKFKEMKSQQKE